MHIGTLSLYAVTITLSIIKMVRLRLHDHQSHTVNDQCGFGELQDILVMNYADLHSYIKIGTF